MNNPYPVKIDQQIVNGFVISHIVTLSDGSVVEFPLNSKIEKLQEPFVGIEEITTEYNLDMFYLMTTINNLVKTINLLIDKVEELESNKNT